MTNKPLLTSSHPEIIENMVDGLFTVDMNRVITSWNKAAEDILGFKSEEVLGKKCDFFNSPTCMGSIINNNGVCPLFSEKKIVRKRCVVTDKNGKDKYLLKNAQLLKDNQGKVIGGVESIVDITELIEREREIDLLKLEIKGRRSFYQIIGNHNTMQNIYSLIDLAKDSDASILIHGETGTGKELVARTIHYTGHRKNNLFVKVDCTALTGTLLDSVLYGHVVSSADGTISKKKGKLEEADGGTLFFNEITDIPPSLQAKLLKFLEAKELETKSEKSSRKIDVRIIAATKKDIQKFINEGSFLEELFNRINEIPITIPRLRDRKTDIPFLVDHFIKRLRSQGEKPVVKCDQHTIDQLMKYNWRGNIRELENTIEYAFLTCRTDTIRFHNIPQQIQQRLMIEGIATDKKRNTNDERVRIANALKMTQGNKTKAAVLLGYSRITLWKNIKRLGVEV